MHDNILPFFDPQQPQESPFDSIRHFDQFGNEFWMARELMVLMDYTKWHNFLAVIELAKENIDLIQGTTQNEIFPLEVKSQTKSSVDYKLSRLACYHIALCCDSRGKNAVKLAKHYFAVKTREAEQIKSIEKQFEPSRNFKELKEYAEWMEYAKRMGEVYGDAYKQRLLPIGLKKYHPDLPILEPEIE